MSEILNTQNTNTTSDGMIDLQSAELNVNALTNLNQQMQYQIGAHNRNVRSLENSNNRYLSAQIIHNQIENNQLLRYDFFAHKAFSIANDINKPNQAIRLWRSGNVYYYRPTPFSDVIEGDKEKIAQEISSRYSNINIVIVDDLNNVLSYRNEIKIDTTYLPINFIPVVDGDVFDPTMIDEIYFNFQGSRVRNHLRYTSYLLNRFADFDLKDEPESYAKHVIQNITTVKGARFLASRLGKFFKHLNSSNAIVMVGNKDVSEGVLLNKILKPIFGSHFCVTISDELLKTQSAEDIIKYKLIYHIDHIPHDEKDQEKLRNILYSILVDKFILADDKFIPVHGQVLITVDEAHPFLKDFLSSSDLFFMDSMDNLLRDLQEEDKISFHKKLYGSLTAFSKELSVLGSMPETVADYDETQNKEFLKLLDNIDEKIVDLVADKTIDPFNSNFESLIPVVERFKHTHITGATGSGKSELLKALIMGDILRADGSVILLEPHGDLSHAVTKIVKDKTRLVYVNPFLSDSKIPTINLFHLPHKSEANIARLTQVILNVLKSVNSDETFTGAMEDVLEMCIRVLLRKGNSSFYELYQLLGSKNEGLLHYGLNSPNDLESEYFENDFGALTKTRDAVRRRLKKLLNDPVFSSMMNDLNTIDLDDKMNTEGAIIIFNIPKGKMPNTYKYFIRFIVEYIQILALKRADIAEEDRIHTHLFIDEAHNAITSSATISEILTESRKYRLYITFAHQAITQIRDTDLRDIITTMTNVKIVGKNTNKTLEAINKTLNTKLEDVEKLETGEFYLSAGNNDILKVNVTDKLLDGKEDISPIEDEEQRQYQLDNYYRDVASLDDTETPSEYLNQILEDFIKAIKALDISYFDKVQDNSKLYEELIYNFNDESDGASGYISKQDLYQYFNLMYSQHAFSNNKDLLKQLKMKDDFFKQNVNSNITYNGKKRLFIS